MGEQYGWNMDTGAITVFGSKASERPVKEKQANLLDWGRETEMLANWKSKQEEAEMNTLFTIGYGGRTPQELVDLLKNNGVKVLLDVRISPKTRVPGFGMQALQNVMEENEIHYIHAAALGNVNYKAGEFAPVQLANEEEGIPALEHFLEKAPTAIMCACRLPGNCHRTYIVSQVKNDGHAILVKDIV